MKENRSPFLFVLCLKNLIFRYVNEMNIAFREKEAYEQISIVNGKLGNEC